MRKHVAAIALRIHDRAKFYQSPKIHHNALRAHALVDLKSYSK